MFFSIPFIALLFANSLGLANNRFAKEEDSFKDTVFKKSIKSVRFSKKGFELSDAVIQLNSGESLVLSFDDLEYENIKNYRYTIQHCDPDWQATDLIESQYLDGYNIDYINNYELSRNTLVSYIHYELEFPNDNMQPKLSGNYVIKVFDEDEEQLILIQRFKVLEPLVSIDAEIVAAIGVDNKSNKQELSFLVNLNKIDVQNPENNILVKVLQNGRTDNMVSGIKPMRNLGRALDYKLNGETVFHGGNEFRNFDTKTFKYNTEYVKSIENVNDTIQVWLWDNKSRAFADYRFSNDINGKWMVQLNEDYDPRINADYCWVHVNLISEGYFPLSKIYVFGEFTNWEINPDYELKYDFDKKYYKAKMFLKQGYYNYYLAYVDNEDGFVNTTKFEGSYYETKNDYLIYVYYNEPGSYYYRLVGFNKVGSK